MSSTSSPQPGTVKDHVLADRNKSVAAPKVYDVFINHRGPDVKETLAYDLYNCLQDRGCRPFLDAEEIEMGDSIPSTIRDAIHSSSVQIAIFSRRYAESSWCLNELVLMFETNSKFIPVFYEVEPWELRRVKEGVGTYAKAFDNHRRQGRYTNDLIDKWKSALSKASDISGYIHKRNSQYHCMLTKIAPVVQQEVARRRPLHVTDYPVGLEELVADFERQCGQNAKMVGIHGMGGSGKTTLAKELFNRKRSNYSGSCFVGDVKESSIPSLQAKIIKDLFNEAHPGFQNISEGTTYLRNRLESGTDSCYLIVLDDVDDEEQIDSLTGKASLGPRSSVIITTRDTGVLERAGTTIYYKMEDMKNSKATELFCWHAFKKPNIAEGYEDLVESFVRLCRGLPLSLKVLGGLLSNCTDRQKWHQELEKVKVMLPAKLIKILKISFDALDNEERQVFLDIACFFIGKPKSMAIRIWKRSGWNAELAVKSLKDKSLVEESYEVGYSYGDLVLRMHDHLRDMGRELADDEPSHLRRLWRPKFLESLESKGFRNILRETNERCFHSFSDDSIRSKITYFVGGQGIAAGTERSTLLWLELDFEEGQLKSIPQWIPLHSLQSLKIVNGCLTRLRQEEGPSSGSRNPSKRKDKGTYQRQSDAEVPFELKELILETTLLEEFPNTLEKFSYLENLNLKGRFSDSSSSRNGMLIEGRLFSEALRKLSKLRSLVLWDFFLRGELDLSNGKDADDFGFSAGGMSHLQTIHLRGVKLTSKISICRENCPRLDSLRLDYMENLTEVHLSNVTTLNNLDIRFCKKLKTVSGNFDSGHLQTLSIKECGELNEVPKLSCQTSLQKITIDKCQKLRDINGVEDLEELQYLYVSTSGRSGGVWNCIHSLKRFPSEVSILIGIAGDGATRTLNPLFFSSLVSPEAVTELHSTSEIGELKMPDSLSAIIICALIGSVDTTPTQSRDRIVTIVLTGQKGLDTLDLYYALLKKMFVVTVNREEELRGLNIFKNIISQLYKGSHVH